MSPSIAGVPVRNGEDVDLIQIRALGDDALDAGAQGAVQAYAVDIGDARVVGNRGVDSALLRLLHSGLQALLHASELRGRVAPARLKPRAGRRRG